MGDTASEKSTTVGGRIVKLEDVDVAAALDSDKPLEPEVAAKLRRKIDYHLMPLMCIVYLYD